MAININDELIRAIKAIPELELSEVPGPQFCPRHVIQFVEQNMDSPYEVTLTYDRLVAVQGAIWRGAFDDFKAVLEGSIKLFDEEVKRRGIDLRLALELPDIHWGTVLCQPVRLRGIPLRIVVAYSFLRQGYTVGMGTVIPSNMERMLHFDTPVPWVDVRKGPDACMKAAGKELLVITQEAPPIPEDLFDAIDSLKKPAAEEPDPPGSTWRTRKPLI